MVRWFLSRQPLRWQAPPCTLGASKDQPAKAERDADAKQPAHQPPSTRPCVPSSPSKMPVPIRPAAVATSPIFWRQAHPPGHLPDWNLGVDSCLVRRVPTSNAQPSHRPTGVLDERPHGQVGPHVARLARVRKLAVAVVNRHDNGWVNRLDDLRGGMVAGAGPTRRLAAARPGSPSAVAMVPHASCRLPLPPLRPMHAPQAQSLQPVCSAPPSLPHAVPSSALPPRLLTSRSFTPSPSPLPRAPDQPCP